MREIGGSSGSLSNVSETRRHWITYLELQLRTIARSRKVRDRRRTNGEVMMVQEHEIGSVLTRRVVLINDYDDLKRDPELMTSWHLENQLKRLQEKCREFLRDSDQVRRSTNLQELLRSTEEDSPVWLAAKLLCLTHQVLDPNLGFDEAVITDPCWCADMIEYLPLKRECLILRIGEYKERLYWKIDHEGAAVDGYEKRRALANARQDSVSARKFKKRIGDQLLVCCLSDQFTTAKLKTMSANRLADWFIAHGSKSIRRVLASSDKFEIDDSEALEALKKATVAKKITSLRKCGLLPQNRA